MKKRTVALLLLSAVLAGLLSGCGNLGKEKKLFSPGYWVEDHFDSPFMNLSFTMPEGWVAADADELAEMSAAANEALDLQRGGTGENPASVYHYELSAKDPDTGKGVLILVHDYGMSTTDYASGLQNGAKAEGATYTAGDTMNLDLAGRRFLVIPLTMADQDAPYQRQYVRKEGDNLINVMMFTPEEGKDAFAELEGYFTKLVED